MPAEITPRITEENEFTLTFERLDNAGVVQETLYYATRAMVTRATDTPANTTFHEYVVDPGGIRRQAFAGGRGSGFVAPTWGTIELINADGSFDSWLDNTLDGWRVTCRYGPHAGEYPAEWRTVYIAWIDGAPQLDRRRVRLTVRGRERLFDKPILTARFDGTAGTYNGINLNGSGLASGRLKHLAIGPNPPYYEPILLSELDNLWFVSLGVPASAY